MFHTKLNIHRIHKWMGLVAAVWLLVLGLTGFLLDHRDTWRWLWQEGVAEKWIPGSVVEKSQATQIRLYQVNKHNPQQQVTGGMTGLWWTHNAGKTWQRTRFNNSNASPMLSAVFFSDDNRLWIASDDGVWISMDGGQSATRSILPGYNVTALSPGENTGKLIGITDRSNIFKYGVNKKEINRLELNSVNEKELPGKIDLSRFVRDIHYGRGVFKIPVSQLWNDITAISMIILPLTGFLFYWLPKRWRRNKKLKKSVAHTVKKQTMRWLFRLHGPSFGMIASIPLLYLAASGILLDHATELRQWMKSIDVTRSWQTPVYRFKSWEQELYGVISYAKQPQKLSVATRLGLFTTLNAGADWQRENVSGDNSLFVWTLRKFKDVVYIGGMGGPNYTKQGNQPWQIVKGSGHMPTDITLDEKANVIWKSRHGVLSSGIKSTSNTKINLPATNYVPWFYLVDALHTGILFHPQWKWINDFIALLAIVLVFTGFIRWWRKKWI